MNSTASHDGADNDPVTDGHQPGIPHLATKIAITVTAQNGDSREHNLVVSRVRTDSAGSVSLGASTTGDIDWIKATLEAERMYRIVVKSEATGNYRTISDSLLVGLYTGDGTKNYIRGTLSVPQGHRHEPRLHYYAGSAGVYYISVRGYEDDTSTYDLLVAEVLGTLAG